jgi:hypothetical protein
MLVRGVYQLMPLAGGGLLHANQLDYRRLTPQGAEDPSYALQADPPNVSYPFSEGAVDSAGRRYRYRAAGLSQIGGELWELSARGRRPRGRSA